MRRTAHCARAWTASASVDTRNAPLVASAVLRGDLGQTGKVAALAKELLAWLAASRGDAKDDRLGAADIGRRPCCRPPALIETSASGEPFVAALSSLRAQSPARADWVFCQRSRSTNFWIFPDPVSGNSSTAIQ